MRRIVPILLALALVLPQTVLAGTAGGGIRKSQAPPAPTALSASYVETQSAFGLVWSGPEGYFNEGYAFEFQLNGSSVGTLPWTPTTNESTPTAARAFIPASGAIAGTNTVGVRAAFVNTSTPEFSDWATTTVVYTPSQVPTPPAPLPLTITGGGTTLNYGSLGTAQVTVGATRTVTVGYQVNGEAISQLATVSAGTGPYSFVALGTGRVVARFDGDTEFAETTATSGVYEVVPIVGKAELSATTVPRDTTMTVTASIVPGLNNASDVVFRLYKYTRQSDGSYEWMLHHSVPGSSVTSAPGDASRVSATFSESITGRWRVAAYHAGTARLAPVEGASTVFFVTKRISKTSAPTCALRNKRFTISATVMPKTSSRYLEFRAYHRERQRDGSYRYVLRARYTPTVTTVDASTSRASSSVSLPSRGTWRILLHYKGQTNVPAISGAYDTVNVL